MNEISHIETPQNGFEKSLKAYDIPTFCRSFSIGRTLVYAEIKAGRLKIAKIGRRTLIPVDAAKIWFEKKICSGVCHE